MKRKDEIDIDFRYENERRLAGGLVSAIDDAVIKRCNACDQIKPVSEYYGHPDTADGLMGSCKECHRRRVYTKKGRGWQYRVIYDPGGGWGDNSTLKRSDINDLLDRDSLYIGTRFRRQDGKTFEVRGKGDDGLKLEAITEGIPCVSK